MSIEAINEQLLRAIGAGVALLEPETFSVRFHNETFGQWFQDTANGISIATLLPDLDVAAIRKSLGEQGRYTTDAHFRRKRRTLIVALTFTQTNADVILMECQNITRIKELETMIETYSAMVERNTRDLQREKERVEKLLLSIMPRNVYEEYKTFGVVTPQDYSPVSVLSLDFLGFDAVSRDLGASVMVSEVNDIYASFDRIGEQFGCERIKTVGDAYVSICGFPEPAENHAAMIASAALRFIRYLARRNETHDHAWQCRIGIATGSVIGSVVGTQKYVYDVFGPAVNRSQRLRDYADAMEIVVDDSVRAPLSQDFVMEEIGVRTLPGFADTMLYRVDGSIE